MWILILLIAVMPFQFNPHLTIAESFLGIFPNFTVIKLLGLMGLWWVITEVGSGRVHLRLLDSPQAKAFVFFVAVILVVGVGRTPGMQLITKLIAIVLMLPIILTAARTEANLRRILAACVVTMTLLYPYLLRQKLRFGGPIGVGLNDVNYFALEALMIVPLAFAFAAGAEDGRSRLLWLLCGLVLVLEVLQTGSRGGFLGFAAMAVFMALRLARRPILTLVGGAALVGVLLVTVPTPMLDRLLATVDDEHGHGGVNRSNEARLIALDAGLELIAENPLTGIGLGNFYLYKTMYPELFFEGPNLAHNTYLEIAAELGLGALAAFLVLFLCAFRSLRRAERTAAAQKRPGLAKLAVGLQASLLGFLVGATFLSAQYDNFLWLLYFVSIALERIALAAPVPQAATPSTSALAWNSR
jgi:O-antigen ligase